MKKTKEIEVTLVESAHRGGYIVQEVINVDGLPLTIKAKLVIEIPEEKILLSFSEIQDAYEGNCAFHDMKSSLGFKE